MPRGTIIGVSVLALVLGAEARPAQQEGHAVASKSRVTEWCGLPFPSGWLGLLYVHVGQPGPAVADFTRALQEKPNSAVLHALRGWAHEASSEHQPAIADFTEAIRLNPRNAAAYVARAGALAQKKEYERAITDCDTGSE